MNHVVVDTSRFDYIVRHGNRPPMTREGYENFPHPRTNDIVCADGFKLSVIAGYGTYCTPRPSSSSILAEVPADYTGPYRAVEVGFPSERPEPWVAEGKGWREFAEDPDEPTKTVYPYVPVEMVRALIASHGGERR